MRINGERLISDLEDFSLITATPGEGVTRFSYSREDIAARQRLKEMATENNMICRTDFFGNIISIQLKMGAGLMVYMES
jgi:allantoate deiminase